MRIRIQRTILDENSFLIVQMIISTLIILFTISNAQSLTSTMFSLSFVNLLFLYLTATRKERAANSGWTLLIWCAASIVFSYLGGSKDFAFADLVSFATFAATIMFMQAAISIDVTRNTAHKLLLIGTVGAALYPIGYFFLGANEYRNMGALLLTMHFSSPNLTGMYLAQGCLFAILCFFLNRNKTVKAIAIIILGFDLYFLALSGARNSIITVLLTMAGIIYVKSKKTKRISPILSFAVSLSPLVFAIAYLLFIDEIGVSGSFDYIVEEGKPLTSRVHIWGNILQTLKGIHWIIGDFSKLRGNLHNTHMTILGSYGIVGIILLVRFLIDVMNSANHEVKSSSQALCLICFFGTIFMGFGEAALFYGSMGMYAIACSYLILARYDWEAETERGTVKSYRQHSVV